MQPIGNFRMFEDEQPVDNPENSDAPAVPLPLIDWLEQTYPSRLPMQPLSDWNIGRLVGQQELIQVLRQIAGRRT